MKLNEHIIYDPYSSKQDFKNAQTSKNSKSTSRERKKFSDINSFTGEKGIKSKKRQSIKTHGEVKKMLTTHFLKPGFMRTACSPENSSSLSIRKNNLTGIRKTIPLSIMWWIIFY